MMDFILCAVSNMFRIYLIYRFAEIFLGKNESGTVKSFLVGTCFYLTNVILYWKFHMVWVNIACNLIGISVIMRLYTSSVKLNLFVTSSVYILILAVTQLQRYYLFTMRMGRRLVRSMRLSLFF